MNEGTPQRKPENPARMADLREALASVLDGVLVVDASGRIVSANDRAADLLRLPPEKLKSLSLQQAVELFTPQVTEPRKLAEQTSDLLKNEPLAADLAFPLSGSAGKLRIYLMPVVQVEDPRPPAAAPSQRTEDEELEYLKKEFISTVSHELRTPLTAIKGAIGLALGGAAGPLASELRELLELAEKNTDRLISLINDILDMFRLETRRMPIRKEPIAIEDSIEREINRNWATAEKTGVALKVSIEPGLPKVNGDRARLEQAIDNLVSNAIKFSPAGSEVLVAARKLSENGSDFVQVSVHDRGKGITPEAQKRIFSKFAQVEDTLTREHQGSGLGLAITHAIIDLHGGRIWFDSAPGQGATFYFTVPATAASIATQATVREASLERSAPVAAVPRTQNPLVLVVDDDHDVACVVCGIFNTHGYEAWPVDRGEEAVEMAERHTPALITLDLLMPGMSGFEVLHRLKQGPKTRSIPVICMSVIDESRRAIALGAENFVSKPIDAQALVRIAGSVLGGSAPGPDGS